MPSRRLLTAIAIVGGAGIWIANASVPASAADGCADGCATSAERQPGPLRVVSLNVLHGFPTFDRLEERLDLVADELGRLDADVALLQEVPWTPGVDGADYLAAATGLNHLYARANGNRWAIAFEEGEAMLSRFPLFDASVVELQPQPMPFEHRVALSAVADTPDGELRLVVAHLSGSDPTVSRGQLAALRAFVAAGSAPTVVAGDFNATPNQGHVAALSPGWIDAFADDPHRLTCCVDDLTAGPEEPLEERIDYLFVVAGPGAPQIVRARTAFDRPFRVDDGRLWASDHLGLFVELRLR